MLVEYVEYIYNSDSNVYHDVLRMASVYI